jgi:23S rRNA pseudouridine2605 synthase
MEQRLQKIIAEAGICSRRHAETLIQSGCVQVNGRMVTMMGSKADPEIDHIKVNGKPLRPSQLHHYVLLNKPKGVVSTAFDPEGRPTVTELIQGVRGRIYPVGRLDYNTEGLLLLTNDGEFAQIIMKAGGHCPKTYLAKVRGTLSDQTLERLRKGIVIDRVRSAPARIIPVKKADNSWYEVTLIEGRNQQIRKMFEWAGHPVEKLKRIRIGFLEDPNLRPGKYRPLTPQEVARFKKMRMQPPAPNHPQSSSQPIHG